MGSPQGSWEPSVPATLFGSGSTAAAPPASTAIINLGTPPAGTYRAIATTQETGTPDTNGTNFEFRIGGGPFAFLPSSDEPTTTIIDRLSLDGSSTVLLRVGLSAGGAGAIYVATLALTRT